MVESLPILSRQSYQSIVAPQSSLLSAGSTINSTSSGTIRSYLLRRRAALTLLFSISIFVILLIFQDALASYLAPQTVSLSARRAAARCLAVFTFALILWATACVPLFVTALAIPPLTVVCRVFLADVKSGHLLSPSQAADEVLRAMGSDAVFMVLGVYTLGAALGKTCFERLLARVLLRSAETPLVLLAGVMATGLGVSTVVSNVFAPVLLLSVLEPLFHTLGDHRRPLAQSLVMGTCIASNIGGMPSPVASPQNIIARDLLLTGKLGAPSFSEWFLITAPQCAVMAFFGYLLIIFKFKPHRYSIHRDEIQSHYSHQPISPTQKDAIVTATFVVTIGLWVTDLGELLFGHSGVVALVAVVILFGSEVLSLDDFKKLPWNTVWLVAGGTALGAAVQSSHLLGFVSSQMSARMEDSSTWFAFLLVVAFMGAVSQGISHTVSAIIVLPLVQRVGNQLGDSRLLVMGAVLACSGAMGLPISSFPNMSAVGALDSHGSPYITPAILFAVGMPMTFVNLGVIVTIGFSVMTAVWNL